MADRSDITADAVALQERDEFRADGWTKVLAPAKVNLHLAIGARRDDGYHEAATVMHALALHDVVYARRVDDWAEAPDSVVASCRMVASDPSIELPELVAGDNIAAQAVERLAEALGAEAATPPVELRIEKSIPAQAGLGGGSSDAAAALVGAAAIWGISPDHPAIEQTARELGADVAFFLHGGCAYLEGTGDEFVHSLEPAKTAVVLVKPDGGVSTAEAYRAFDEAPAFADSELAAQVAAARAADEVALFNNLAPASEGLLPELAEARSWLVGQEGVEGTLLSGSGAATFALCESFAAATRIVACARARGWWSRATALSSLRAAAVKASRNGQSASTCSGSA